MVGGGGADEKDYLSRYTNTADRKDCIETWRQHYEPLFHVLSLNLAGGGVGGRKERCLIN